MMSSQNCLFNSQVSFYERPQVPFMANRFGLCYPFNFISLIGLFYKDFTSVRKCLRLLSNSGGVACSHICKVLIPQHFSHATTFPPQLSMTRYTPSTLALQMHWSTSNTQSSSKLFRCRTSLSLIPSLARHLLNPKQGRSLILQFFLRSTCLYLIIY